MCGMCAGVPGCTRVCAGVYGCLRVYLGVRRYAQVCGGVPGCVWVCIGVQWVGAGVGGSARMCTDVHGCARLCTSVRRFARRYACVGGMNFQNFFWRIESLHQRTLIRILYEFFKMIFCKRRAYLLLQI